MKNTFIKLIFALAFSVICMAVNFTAVLAQADFNGSITLGYTGLDDDGNRSAAPELFDTYDGFTINNIKLNGHINPRTRYYLSLTDINFDGRRAALDITNYDYYSFKANYRQTRGVFGAGETPSVDRKFYSGRLEIKPIKKISGYFEYRGNKDEGDRVINDITDQGLFGNQYDRNTTSYKGGIKFKHNGHHLEVFYGVRNFDDKISDTLDTKTAMMGANLFINAHSKLKAIFDFKNLKAEKDKSGDNTKESRSGISFLIKPFDNLLITPKGSYRKVTGEPYDPDFVSYNTKISGDYRLPYKSNFNASIGYEIREADTNRVTALGYSLGLKGRPHKYFGGKFKYDGYRRRDTKHILVTGYEDRIGIIVEGRIYPCSSGRIKVGYKTKTRENDDISTRVQTKGFYLKLQRNFDKRAMLNLAVSSEDIEYTSPGRSLNYKMKVGSGNLEFIPVTRLSLTIAGTVFDFSDDIETTKVDFSTGIKYRFQDQFGLSFTYRRYEIDGYNLTPTFYDANIFNVRATFYFKK